MPHGVKENEKVLHVPVNERLLADFKATADALGIPIKQAVADALGMWTAVRSYDRALEHDDGS